MESMVAEHSKKIMTNNVISNDNRMVDGRSYIDAVNKGVACGQHIMEPDSACDVYINALIGEHTIPKFKEAVTWDVVVSDPGSHDVGLSATVRSNGNAQMGLECARPNNQSRDAGHPNDLPILNGSYCSHGLGQNADLRSDMDRPNVKRHMGLVCVGSNNQFSLCDADSPLIVCNGQSPSQLDVEGPIVVVGEVQDGPSLACGVPTSIEVEFNCDQGQAMELIGVVQLEEGILSDEVPETQFHSLRDNEKKQYLRRNGRLLEDKVETFKGVKGFLSNQIAETQLCEVPITVAENLDVVWVKGVMPQEYAITKAITKRRRGRPRKSSTKV
ncbi:UDP-N-acetylmuramoyl-tripeptide--D-alanyl-D-alanine ligase [Sesbania bispinosa]|nr:UDP-N-acetylmuramoyl-tripeptide--D-alanyl-D-alanine ligase [Sesbania bispinosa]